MGIPLPRDTGVSPDHSLAEILASSDDAIIGMTLDGIITRWNPGAERLYGYTADEAIGQHISLLVPADRMDELTAIIAQLRQGQRIHHFETIRVRKDGTRRHISLSLSPIHDERGHIVAVAGVARDMTERIEADAMQARLAAIVEAAADGILSVDRDGTILSWNRGAEQLYGYTASEAIGQSVAMLRPPEAAHDISEHVARVWQGEDVTEQEAVRLTKEGRRILVCLTLFPIRDAYGKIVAISSISRDLTVLRQTEAALRLRDRALEASRNGIVITDPSLPDHPIIDINPAFTALTGYTRDEVLGRNCRFLQGPDTDQDTVGRLRDALREHHDFAETLLNYRKDGSPFWNDLSIAAVRDTAGAVTHFIGVLSDATERMRHERELQVALEAAKAANRAKGAFLDMMSHELRTPLQATLGYSEFLLADPESSLTPEQRQDIDIIHQASTRMLTLITQLLDLSRADADRLNLAREAVDLRQVMEQVRQDVAPQAAVKGLMLKIAIPPTLPPVKGDAERVRQVLLNLMGNAVKFTPAGFVRMTARLLDPTVVEIDVSDTGIGISEAALPHLFTAFYQEEHRLSHEQGGAGLGLAIARKLVTEMGGSITVTSEPCIGSTFRVSLPVWPS